MQIPMQIKYNQKFIFPLLQAGPGGVPNASVEHTVENSKA